MSSNPLEPRSYWCPFEEKEVRQNNPIYFTPGPWAVSADGEGYIIEDPRGRSGDERKLAFVYLEKENPSGFESSEDEAKANARLIAAAPELLDALALWMHWHYNDGHIAETYDEVVHIAKMALESALPNEVKP